MPTIVHFEIPVDDVDRAKTFYQELFDWKIEQYSDSDYWIIDTGDAAEKKALHGGMMQRQQPQQTAINYIDVPSVDDYARRVTALGGKVVAPKMTVPGMGYFAVCVDPDNNAFGLWEIDQEAI